MSHNIDSIKISCLLYLDRPMQADLSDFLSDLTPSRKGEVLRELLENGWKKYKEENGVGLDPEEFAQLIIENNKKENKKRTKAKTTVRKANSPQPKTEPIVQKESNTKKEDREKGKEENKNKEVSNDKEVEQNDIKSEYQEKSALSSVKSFSMEDLDEDNDDVVVDPLSKMKMKNS
jgi:primosomal protein N'